MYVLYILRRHAFHPDTIIMHLHSGMRTSKHYNQRRRASFVAFTEEVEYMSDQACTLLCPLCSEVLNQPIELACNNFSVC